eukprot:scaffold271845_cov29-Attheya_sp.AAC.1
MGHDGAGGQSGLKFHEGLEGGCRLSLGIGFQTFAKCDKGQEHGSRFKGGSQISVLAVRSTQ